MSANIDGIDFKQGLENCCGSIEAYWEVLESFLEDSAAKLKEFKPLYKSAANKLNEQDLRRFSAAVHAIKGVSAIIGARLLSQKAAALEIAGKNGNKKIIQKDFPDFYQDLKTLAEKVQSYLNTIHNSEAAEEDYV